MNAFVDVKGVHRRLKVSEVATITTPQVIGVGSVRLQSCLMVLLILGRVIMYGLKRVQGFMVVGVRNGKFLGLLFCMVICRYVTFPQAKHSRCSKHAGGICGISPSIPFLTLVSGLHKRISKVLILRGPYFLRRALINDVRSVFRGIIFRRAASPRAQRRRGSVSYNGYCHVCSDINHQTR